MTGHDAEEFGGELYHDIVARIEQSWSLWLATITRVQDGESQVGHLAISLIDETMSDDDRAVELIRQLLENGDSPASGSFSSVNPMTGSLDDARREMSRNHNRLLGSVEVASQSSDDVLEQVRERIGGITWMRYEARATRLASHLDSTSS